MMVRDNPPYVVRTNGRPNDGLAMRGRHTPCLAEQTSGRLPNLQFGASSRTAATCGCAAHRGRLRRLPANDHLDRCPAHHVDACCARVRRVRTQSGTSHLAGTDRGRRVSLTSALYQLLRLSRDVNAVRRGPRATAKRAARTGIYRPVAKIVGRTLR